jgi:hypothetical protein
LLYPLKISKKTVHIVQTVQEAQEPPKNQASTLDDILDDWTITQKISSENKASKINILDDTDDMDNIFPTSPKSDDPDWEVWDAVMDVAAWVCACSWV